MADQDVDYSSLPRTREEALSIGSRFYFSGKPCRWKRHLAPRYTSIGRCVVCQAQASLKLADKDREEFRRLSRAKYERNAARIRKQAQARYAAALGENRRKELAYYYANKGQYAATAKRYRERNKHRLKAMRRESRERRKEAITTYNRAYKEANRALYASCEKARHARKLKAMPVWVDREQIDSFYVEARRLTAETGVEHQVDHIMPLQSDVLCGLHVPWNLQVISKERNLRKSNQILQELGCAFVSLAAASMVAT